MEDLKKTEIFETMPMPRAVASLCVPTIVSSLVMILYNLADTYFVAMLNDPVQNAAVTLAAPVLLAFNAVNNLFGVGGSSMMSRALGVRDFDRVHRSSAFSFYGALISALIFSLLCTVFRSPLLNLLGADADTFDATGKYLLWTTMLGAAPSILNVVMGNLVRAEGAALHAGIGTMSGCLLNIVLDPVFIMPWGLGMGAAGAGCATFISNCAACAYFFVLLFVKRGRTNVCIKPSMFGFRREIVAGVCGVGIPAAIQNLLNVTGMTVLNNFTSAFGADAVAAMGIAHKINMVPMYVAMGLSQGVMPLVSYNYASRNIKRMKNAVTFTAKIALSFVLVIVLVYFTCAEHISRLFMDNDVIVAYSAAFLRGMCLAHPFQFVDFLAVGVFQACGFGKMSLLFAILRKVVLEIPLLFVLNRLFPLYGLAYAQPCAELILAVAAVAVLVRIFKRLSREAHTSP